MNKEILSLSHEAWMEFKNMFLPDGMEATPHELIEDSYALAMMLLQSDRYQEDAKLRHIVNNILTMTRDKIFKN